MATSGPAHVAQTLSDVPRVAAPVARPRHLATVRITHWIATACFFALLLSGIEILISHPRFYWGSAGNDLTTPLFKIPIPSSRSHVPTGYSYSLPDQNGWSRALHFQSAWALLICGVAYLIVGFFAGHFRRNLLPDKKDFSPRTIMQSIAHHLRFARPGPEEAWSYNVLQRLAYVGVIFIIFPLMIWTGLALSPGFVSAFPMTQILIGGRQTARTLHFFATIALLIFFFVHVVMVWRAGFWNRVRAMITGRATPPPERI